MHPFKYSFCFWCCPYRRQSSPKKRHPRRRQHQSMLQVGNPKNPRLILMTQKQHSKNGNSKSHDSHSRNISAGNVSRRGHTHLWSPHSSPIAAGRGPSQVRDELWYLKKQECEILNWRAGRITRGHKVTDLRFQKHQHLRLSTEFKRVYDLRNRASDQHLLVYSAANESSQTETPYSRIGLSVLSETGTGGDQKSNQTTVA